MRIVITALLILTGVMVAQPYRCDWSVNGIGGASMASSAYRSEATAGQTAVGLATASGLLAHIGFWLSDYTVGIQEQEIVPVPGRPMTRLEAVAPNPARGRAVIRYSLATEGPMSLQIHDLTGRTVRMLAQGTMLSGRHTAAWNGCDGRGRRLAEGVYFVQLATGGYRATEKVLLAR